jgi:hypothetical protein
MKSGTASIILGLSCSRLWWPSLINVSVYVSVIYLSVYLGFLTPGELGFNFNFIQCVTVENIDKVVSKSCHQNHPMVSQTYISNQTVPLLCKYCS